MKMIILFGTIKQVRPFSAELQESGYRILTDALIPQENATSIDGRTIIEFANIIEAAWSSTRFYRIYFVSDNYVSYAEKTSTDSSVNSIVSISVETR